MSRDRRAPPGWPRIVAVCLALSFVAPSAAAQALTGDRLQGTDRDADGYADAVEQAAGSDPGSATSTPLTLSAAAIEAALQLGAMGARESLASAESNIIWATNATASDARAALASGRVAAALALADARDGLARAATDAAEALGLSGDALASFELAVSSMDAALAAAAVEIDRGFREADQAVASGEEPLALATKAFSFARFTSDEAFASAQGVLDSAQGSTGGVVGSTAVLVYTSEVATGLIGDEDGGGIPAQGLYADLDRDGVRAPDGSEELTVTDTDQDAFSDRLEFFLQTDPTDSDSRPLVPHLGEWFTSLGPRYASAAELADGRMRAGVTLERRLGDSGAQGTPLTEITLTAPTGWTLGAIAREDIPPAFLVVETGTWKEGELEGRDYAKLIGSRDADLTDAFFLPLLNATPAAQGPAALHVRACDGPRFFTTCTEGANVEPAFTVDTIAPTLSFDASGPTSGTLTKDIALLAWGVGADALQYALAETPLTDSNAVWAAIETRPTTRSLKASGGDGLRTLYAGLRDAANNSRFTSDALTLDSTPPALVFTNSTPPAATGWTTTLPTLDLQASDAHAGVAALRLEIAGVGNASGIGPSLSLAVPRGTPVVHFHAEDALGNVRSGTLPYQVDDAAPTIVTFLSDTSGAWAPTAPVAFLNASDDLSGVHNISAWAVVNGIARAPADVPSGAPMALAHDGLVVLRYRVKDVAGNLLEGELPTARVDRIAPDAPVLLAPAIVGADAATLSWSAFASEGPSGFGRWRVEERVGTSWVALHTSDDANERSLTVSGGFVDGASRAFRVVARSAAGLETASAEAVMHADFAAPTVIPVIAGGSRTRDGFVWLVEGAPTFTVIANDAGALTGTYGFETAEGGANSWAVLPGENLARALPESAAVIASWEVTDEAGHANAQTLAAFGVDTVAPVLSSTLEAAQGSGGHYSPPVFINFSAADATSGLHTREHSLDGATWLPGDAVQLLATGEHTVRLRATDAAGHTSVTTVPLRIDILDATLDAAPLVRELTELSGALVAGAPEAAVRVEVDGVEHQALVDGDRWSLALPAPLADGLHSLRVQATDTAGRASVPRTSLVRVDSTPPALDIDLSTVTNASSPILALAAEETLAGPATVERLTPSGAVPLGTVAAPGSLALALPHDGTFTIRIRAVDLAGNEATLTRDLLRDTAAPQVGLLSPARVLHASSVTLAFAALDANTMAHALTVTRDDGEPFDGTALTLTVPLANDTRRLSYAFAATDVAGNVGHISGLVTIVDPTAPVLHATFEGVRGNAGWFRSNVTVDLSAEPASASILSAARLEGEPEGALAPAIQVALSGTARHVVDAQATLERDGLAISSPLESFPVPVDLDAPRVTLVAPLDAVEEGARVVLRAEASDEGSGLASVTAVVHRHGSVQAYALAHREGEIHEATIGPFLHGEEVRVVLRAVDVAGHSTASAERALRVRDATPPFVVLTAPAERVTGTVAFAADASDAAGIASLSFEVDGAPAASAWDTRFATNGPHLVTARAVDASGNVATDTRTVTVDNPPSAGPLVLSPMSDTLPDPSTPSVTLALEASAAGGRAPEVTFFARTSSGAPFQPHAATLVCEPACVHRASLAGPFLPGSTIEAYATVSDGASALRVPASGVLSAEVRLPASAALATWIDAAQAALTEPEEDLTDGHLDIVRAGVIRSLGTMHFAVSVREPFADNSAPFFIDFHEGGTSEPFATYELRRAANGTWTVPTGTALTADAAEFRLRVPRARLALDLGDIPADLRVAFRSGTPPAPLAAMDGASRDSTALAALDLVAPAIETIGLSAETRNETVDLLVNVTDDDGSATVLVLATLDGAPLPPLDVVGGAVALGQLDGGTLEVVVLAVDAAGNRASSTASFTLADAEPPLALAAALGATELPQGASFVLSADTSRDNVGIASFAWHFDADQRPDAFGRRVVVSFEEAGDRIVRLVVEDAAGNFAGAEIALRVLDVTPPALALLAPAPGAAVLPGLATLRFLAPDANRVTVHVDGGDALLASAESAGLWTLPVFLAEGEHAIMAIAEDAAGNVATFVEPALIAADGTAPVVTLSVGRAVAGSPTTLIARIDEALGVAAIEWDFGDGEALSCDARCATTPHTYMRAGAFLARVHVVDRAGHSAATSLVLQVEAGPSPPAPPAQPAPSHGPPSASVQFARPAEPQVAVLGPLSGRVGETITFRPQPDARYLDATYSWTFGDGATEEGADVRHAWSAPGEYPVIVTARAAGLAGTALLLIDIRAALMPRDEVAPLPNDEVAPPPVAVPVVAPPVTRVAAPEGITRSPATVLFDAGAGAVVYWRVPGADWRTTNPAIVAGEGSVIVEFYAFGPGGQEETRTVALDLDGAAPEIGELSLEMAAVSARVSDAHLLAVEARVLDDDGTLVLLLPLAREDDRWRAELAQLAPGTYSIEIVARDALGRESTALVGEYRATTIPLEETALPGAERETPAGGLWVALLAACLAVFAAGRRRRQDS